MTRSLLPMFVAGILLIATSCKKETGNAPFSSVSSTRRQLTLDSIYLYARETYFWNDALQPYATFNPHQYETTGTELTDYRSEVYAISQIKINALTGQAYEKGLLNGSAKYSFINSTGLQGTGIAAVGLNDIGSDFGITLTEYGTDDIRVAMVNPGSPAALAGIQRADQILAVNGTPVVAGMNIWANAMAQSSIQLTIRKRHGQVKETTLMSASYKSPAIVMDTVLKANNVKTGYLAIARFSELSLLQQQLQNSFQRYARKGITELIIDLRYNSGGYVESAEYLANLIIPASLQGKVAYTEHYNDAMQQGKATILQNQPYINAAGNQQYINGRKATYADIDFSVAGNTHYFNKKGELNGITKVSFITSLTTASASELLINILKPYLQINLIGSNTYGKPVGYFRIGIDHYSLYLTNFWLKNALGDGNYFSGMPVGIKAEDDVTHTFGDKEESCIAAALSTRAGHSVTALPAAPGSDTHPTSRMLISTARNGIGMIENRFRLKKN